MRRRVCEAKKEVSGSEASDGSRKVQKFATGRGSLDRNLMVQARCPLRTNTSLRAVHVIAPPDCVRVTIGQRETRTRFSSNLFDFLFVE